MCRVGRSGVDLSDEGHFPQHVPVFVAFVGSALHESNGQFAGGGAEQHHGGLAHAFVDFPGELGVLAPRVGVFFEVDRSEHETANVGRVVTLIS